MAYHPAKFKALVHYICKQCHDPEKLAWVKLHKILWYSDSDHYIKTREPITGETYIKKPYGEFSTHLGSVVNELVAEGKLYVGEADYHNYNKGEFVAKGEVDTSLFTERELRIVNEWTKTISEDHSSTSISDKSHKIVYHLATLEQEIPYQALLVANVVPLNEEDIKWAQDELARLYP